METQMRNSRTAALLMAACAMCSGSVIMAADVDRAGFGKLPDGQAVEAIKLSNAHGVSATVITYGATLQSMILPDRAGKMADVALGYPSLDGYVVKSEYFGSTVGRFANRIAKGRFSLDGKSYQTPVNNNGNSLHGGDRGFDKVVWEVIDVKRGASASVTLRYVSPDGDQGYPGTLTVDATYAFSEANELTIEYAATTDRPTISNITNHAYWNLAGEGAPAGAMGHRLTIAAQQYTPVNETLIPTGEQRAVAGTVFDFRQPTAIGARVRDAKDEQIRFGRGYDHNFVVASDVAREPRFVARVEDPDPGGRSSCGRISPGCSSIREISWTARSWASPAASIARAMLSCSSHSCSPMRPINRSS